MSTSSAARPEISLILLAGFAALTLSCASTTAPPKPYKAGSRIEPATLYDQNEKAHRIDESVQIIFFAREMEGGKVIRALLDAEGPEYLMKQRALYVADISDMPTLIANMVAIPKMREERPYPTLLDRDGKITAPFPSEEGRVTILVLDRLRVKAIHYRGSVGGLRDAAEKQR
jgi:hypothetical protein